EVIYDYHDPEQDGQSGTQIRWYQDGICQEDLNDQSNVPPSRTGRGQLWYATVTPSDGENLGETVTTGSVEIANTIPMLSSVKLEPQAANTGDNLTLNYIYSDADNDEETEAEIKWYKEGTEQNQLQNYREVSSSLTEMGQRWKAEVRVSDGYQFSELYQTQEMEIINSRPQARNVTISPNQPRPEDDLVVNYEYWDADGHQQADTHIRWYKDGKLEDEWEGLSQIECDATREGEVWQAEIEPYDGLEYGIAVKSNLVTIKSAVTQHMPAIQTNTLQTKQEQDYIDNSDDKKKEEKTAPNLRAIRLYGRQQVSLHQGNIELEFKQPCKDVHLWLESSIISDKQSYPLADYLGWDSDIYTIKFSKGLEQSYKLKIKNNSDPSRALLAYWSQEDKNWIIIRDAEAGSGYVEAMVGRHQQITVCVLKLNTVTRHLNLNGSRQAFMGLGRNLLKFLLPSGLQKEVSLEVKAISRDQQDKEVLLLSVLDRYHKPLDSTIDIKVLYCSPQGQAFGLSEVLVNGKNTSLKGKTVACGVTQTQVLAGRFFVLNCH
ncbi:MAG: hypothetical protein PHN32_04220, partial [Actinomycetota bacterium]|nr:hypothetical protein [Actinomycetota bacterium]